MPKVTTYQASAVDRKVGVTLDQLRQWLQSLDGAAPDLAPKVIIGWGGQIRSISVQVTE